MRAFSENSGEGSAPFPMLGPHPRVRLNGVTRPSISLSTNFVSGEVRRVKICRKAVSENCTTSLGGGRSS
jgi:hypothetical protein